MGPRGAGLAVVCLALAGVAGRAAADPIPLGHYHCEVTPQLLIHKSVSSGGRAGALDIVVDDSWDAPASGVLQTRIKRVDYDLRWIGTTLSLHLIPLGDPDGAQDAVCHPAPPQKS